MRLKIALMLIFLIFSHATYSFSENSLPGIAATIAPPVVEETIGPDQEPFSGCDGGTCGECREGSCESYSMNCSNLSFSICIRIGDINLNEVDRILSFPGDWLTCLRNNPFLIDGQDFGEGCIPPIDNSVEFGICLLNENFRRLLGSFCSRLSCAGGCSCKKQNLDKCAEACGALLKKNCRIQLQNPVKSKEEGY